MTVNRLGLASSWPVSAGKAASGSAASSRAVRAKRDKWVRLGTTSLAQAHRHECGCGGEGEGAVDACGEDVGMRGHLASCSHVYHGGLRGLEGNGVRCLVFFKRNRGASVTAFCSPWENGG